MTEKSWVSLAARVPEKGKKVLLGNARTGEMITGELYYHVPGYEKPLFEVFHADAVYLQHDFTHWMNLPELPKMLEVEHE